MNRVIIITGSGRSGTSWLHDVTTANYNYRRIFEPLHPEQVLSVSEYAGLFLDETDSDKKLKKYLDNVFHKKTDDAWIRWIHFGITNKTKPFRKALQYTYNVTNFKFWAKNRSIKFIQANLMISWLAAQYNYPIVYLIRDPYAVIRSQFNMGWGHNLEAFTTQEKVRTRLLNEDLLAYTNSLVTVIEKLTARWCIENVLAVQAIKKSLTHKKTSFRLPMNA